MKNIRLVISVLVWALASACFAVKLPTSPYSRGYAGPAENHSFQMGTGISIEGYSVVGSGEYNPYSCTTPGVQGDPTDCQTCCEKEVLIPCEEAAGDDFDKILECGTLNTTCIKSCTNGTSLPLDAPTAFLLALVAAYGAVAVYRRRKVQEA